MGYVLKYQARFDSFQPLLTYRLDIYKKDYDGSVTDILLSGNPVIHEWQDDDPKVPIKGSTLKINILTDLSTIALTDFYSEDDYGFYCEFIRLETEEVLFKGYLLQDNSQELQVDFTHEIQLTFTDGLGLLKDITLDKAAVILGSPNTYTGITIQDNSWAGGNKFNTASTAFTVLHPGDEFSITYSSVVYPFVCLNVTYDALFGYIIWVDRIITFPSGSIVVDFTFDVPYPLVGYMPLIEIYALCLRATYINTGLNCYSRLYPQGGTTERLLEDTYIQIETFKNTNDWMNCYEILEQINSRFNFCLFQAHGTWQLIRWDELYRYTTDTGASFQYHTYSNSFAYVSTNNNNEVWTFRKGNDMETGVLKSINRANQYVKETFNYIQPDDLLCNSNLQDLGDLRTEYTSGTYIIKEYDLPNWYDGPYSPYPDRFIRITIDNDATSTTYLQELDRNIIISGYSGSNPESIKSCDIAITKDDSFEVNFSFRTNISQSGPINLPFDVTLTDGTITYFLQTDGTWTITSGFVYAIGSSDDTIDWHTVTMKSKPLPISGILNVYLAQNTTSGAETLYKDLSFTMSYLIAGSGKVNGHTHTDSQVQQIKQNIDKDIKLDDVPRVSIRGALFLESYTNLVRDLTYTWLYPSASYSNRLGQVTTQEALFTTYKMRSKYEGNYLFINQEDLMLTPLSLFVDNLNYNFFRYAVGAMTIDYKNAQANITLWEILDSPAGDFEPGGAGITLAYLEFASSKLYEFKYLYEK